MKVSDRWQVQAWALYDFAYTIFSMNILSTYFQLWVIQNHGHDFARFMTTLTLGTWHLPLTMTGDLAYGLALFLSGLLVIVCSPLLGQLSDRLGRRKPFIAFFCWVSCLTIGLVTFTHNVFTGLALFVCSIFAFQLANTFYNAQLPDVSTPSTIGRISGYGLFLGYIGSVFGQLAVLPFVTGHFLHWKMPWRAGGNQAAFLPTAVLFAVFALPLLLVVKEPSKSPTLPGPARSPGAPGFWKQLATDPALRDIAMFLLASLFFFDAVNTVIAFMATYAVQVVGFDPLKGEVQHLLIFATVAAVAGAYPWGWLCDRIGPKRALVANLMLWVGVLLLAILVHDKSLFFFLVAPLAGVALGGTTITSRPLLVALSPPERIGEFFGLGTVFLRISALLGPLLWTGSVTLFVSLGTARYSLAMGLELVALLIGSGILVWGVEEPYTARVKPALPI